MQNGDIVEDGQRWPCVVTGCVTYANNLHNYSTERIPGPQTLNQHHREEHYAMLDRRYRERMDAYEAMKVKMEAYIPVDGRVVGTLTIREIVDAICTLYSDYCNEYETY